MKYLCLVYYDEDELAAPPARGHARRTPADDDEHAAWRGRGVRLAAHALYPEQTTTVRVRARHLVISDGPRHATRDRLGGFYLIEATDLNDAIRVVAQMPPARQGCVEIRAVTAVEPREPYPDA